MFERLLSDWFSRLEGAIAADVRGWEKVELVLTAGFRFFADNPAYVRLMRREAIDGGAHLGIDLAARAPALLRRRGGLLPPGDGRGHASGATTPTSSSSPATARCSATSATPRSSRVCSTSTPWIPTRSQQRLEHVTAFFRAALVP